MAVILPPSADSLTNFLTALNDPASLKETVSQLLSAVKDLDQRRAVLEKANEEARNLKDQHDKQAALIGEKVDYLNDQEDNLKKWEDELSQLRDQLQAQKNALDSSQQTAELYIASKTNDLIAMENLLKSREVILNGREIKLHEKETKVQETQDLLDKQLNKIKEITNG
jgi:vacuolar-type H+-ATPase subunit I/STV1